MENTLSTKEIKKRDFILNGNIFKVVGMLTLPLLIYSLFNYVYGIIDLYIVSYDEITSVLFIEEIKNAISAFGSGIAIGGTVIVARFLGKNDIKKAKEVSSQTFIFALLVSVVVSIITVFLSKPLLILLNAPESVLLNGIGYYRVQMLITTIMSMNSVFIGLEKSKGNTGIVLKLNILAMIVKILLSLLFVKVFHLNATFVALSTLIAQLSILMVGIKILFSKKNSLRIELKHFKFDKQIIKDIVFLSIPIFIGKFLFSIGKVIINSMASAYGDDVFAAFGLAIRIPSVASSIAQTFEDSEVSIVSQNLGNNNIKRAFKTYNVSILYSLIVAIPLIVLLTIFFKPLLYFFEPNIPSDVAIMTTKLFNWERFSALTSAMIGITANFFVCFKKSEISFILNITRIFVFRIPVLFLFQLLNVGYIALGLTMFISNLGTLIVGVVLLIIFYYKVKQYGYKGISYSGDPLVILS